MPRAELPRACGRRHAGAGPRARLLAGVVLAAARPAAGRCTVADRTGSMAVCGLLNETLCRGLFRERCSWLSCSGNTTGSERYAPDFSRPGCRCFGSTDTEPESCRCHTNKSYCTPWEVARCRADKAMRGQLHGNWNECSHGEREACESLGSEELCSALGSRVAQASGAPSCAACAWFGGDEECSPTWVFGCQGAESCAGQGGKWCQGCTAEQNSFASVIPGHTIQASCHPVCHGGRQMCQRLKGCTWTWIGSPSSDRVHYCTAGCQHRSGPALLMCACILALLVQS